MFHLFYYANNITRILTILLVAVGFVKLVEYATSDKGRTALLFFYDAIEKHGWLSMLLSGRDDYVNTKVVAVINSWNIINYLFGGQDQNRFCIEMDFFDLFLFFGIIGSIFYLLLMFNTIFQVKKVYPFFLFFISCFFLLAFLGGHFFSSAVNSIYLCLVGMFFYVSHSIRKLEGSS